jgi:plasmid stability protein
MATLNIKNFPDEIYQRLQELAKREHRSVSQEVVHLLEQARRRPVRSWICAGSEKSSGKE